MYISSKMSIYKTVQKSFYEIISEFLFKKSLGRFKWPGKIELLTYTAASYLPTKHWHLQKAFCSGDIKLLFVSIFKIRVYCAICVFVCVCVLYQNCILLEDSRSSPWIFSNKGFVSITTCTGLSLHGATSKRGSMCHSPVFTCIRANRIPVKGIKERLSNTSNCRWIITDIIISADARKQTSLTSGISS